jgi:hypothetical protein
MKLPHSLLLACLGTAPLCAQQVESKAAAPTTGNAPATGPAAALGNPTGAAEKADDRPAAAKPYLRPAPAHAMLQEEQKPVAYIGVLTRGVPEELRDQFSLPEGFGLLVEEVMPDSPAKAAGLKKHDVLVKFEDQQLVNMEQLMALVQAKKKGALVQLEIITGGKATQVPITLGEHMIAGGDHQPHHGYGGWAQPNGNMHRGSEQYGFQNQNAALHEQLEQLQQKLREYQRHIQELSQMGNGASRLNFSGEHRHHSGGRPQTGISIPPGTDLQQFQRSQSHAAANATRRDDSGEYTLKSEDGKTTFTARPTNGQEQSWPVTTEAERQAVPQEFRDKLRLMNSASGGLQKEGR